MGNLESPRSFSGAMARSAFKYPKTAGPRNGMPDPAPYVWREGEQQRADEVAAKLAEIRASLHR